MRTLPDMQIPCRPAGQNHRCPPQSAASHGDQGRASSVAEYTQDFLGQTTDCRGKAANRCLRALSAVSCGVSAVQFCLPGQEASLIPGAGMGAGLSSRKAAALELKTPVTRCPSRPCPRQSLSCLPSSSRRHLLKHHPNVSL